MNILVATRREAILDDFLSSVRDKGHAIATVATLDEVKKHLRKNPPALAILDLDLEGKALTEAVVSLLRINAGVHTAVVSAMTEDAFHTCTEGLGILMALPLLPKAKDAKIMLEKLPVLQAPQV